MKNKTPLFVCGLLAGVAALFTPSLSVAAPLLYEGFSYGASDVPLSTVSGTALGLDGTGYTTNSSSTQYQAAGLTFGDLEVTGGRASFTWHTSIAYTASRGLNFNLTSGTLYGSYLISASDSGSNNGIDAVMFGATGTNDNTAELVVAGNTAATGASMISGLKTYGTTAIAGGASMTTSTTFMVLFQVTNIGAATGETQTIDMWALSDAQFSNFKLDGLAFSELQAATLGSAADNVWQRLSYNLTVSGTNNISLTDDNQLGFIAYRARNDVDEIRISNLSLDDVTPVPEPSAVLLLAGGLSVLTLRRRRR